MQKSLLKQKFKEFKISKEGLDKGYDKMQKILSQMNTLKIKPEPKDVNMKFLRGLPPSWYGIALILKTKGGLEYISFDDLYNKLKFLEIDTKGYSSNSSTLSNAAFVSTARSSQGNLSYQESENGSHITTQSVSPGSSSSKGSLKSKCSVVDDVIYTFFANRKIDQHLVYEDLDQMNKEEFEEYDLKHQMAMLSIKVHRFETKHGQKIKFNGRENARFDKKLVKCFNCKIIGHFLRECQAQGGQNSNNYHKYKSKEAGKDGSDSKAMVVVDGSIDWDKQTDEGNTEPRSLENFGMIAGIKIELDADSEGEVVSAADNAIPVGVSISTGNVVATVVSPQSETEFALMGLSTEELMTKLDNEIANQAKWNKSGELGIDDSQFSIFHTNSDDLEGQPIYNRFALVDHIKAVPPPLTGNYMPPSNIPDIDKSQMVYGKKATDSSEIKSNDDSISYYNDSAHFDFSDRSSEPSTNDLQTCDSSVECSRPNHSDRDSTDYISSVFAPASESGDTIVIDCYKQEDFPSICSIETDVKSSKPLCNKFGSFNKESHFRKHKSVASKSCYVCSSYFHLIKDCDLHEQRFTKRNAEGKGKLGRRPTGKQANPNDLNQFLLVSQTQFLLDNSLMLEKAKDRGIVNSGYSRSMSGNKDKLENFEYFDGGEVTFGGSTGKISGEGTIKTKNLNFENVLYVEELQHFNLISVSQICDQSHRVFFTENKCLVLSKDFPLPDPSMVILSIPRKYNLYTFSLNELAPKGPLTCLVSKASHDESTLWHRILGHVNFKNMNKLVKGNLVRENQFNHKVKAIRCDNGIEFKNSNLIEFCGSKGIRRDYSNARTSQQNGVTERKNLTLIEAARTMLADSLLTTLFWSEAVATACYVLNRFDKKSDEGYIVGYSISSKAYRVYNLVSRKIKETMNLNFLENKPFVAGTGQAWMFDIDYLTDSLNYSRVSITNLTAGSQGATPSHVGSQEDDLDSDDEPDVLIIQSTPTPVVPIVDEATTQNDGTKSELAQINADNLDELAELQALQRQEQVGKEEADRLGLAFPSLNPILGIGTASIGSSVSASGTPPSHVSAGRPTGSAGRPVSARKPTGSAGKPVSTGRPTSSAGRPVSAGRLSVPADRSSVPARRILGKVTASASSERFPRALSVENSNIHDGLKIFNCPKSGIFTFSSYDEEFSGPNANNLASSVDVWVLVTLPDGKRAIGTKWILKNKRDARGIVCRNKARLVAQGHRQEEGIDYTDVFAPVARIKAIRLFLAFASFIGFKVYQMDVKSAFLYEKIAEEVYVTQPRGFEDLDHPKKVYKVVKALYGLH
nr:ribonuclease H-like domain-containing protein [Tanacetum cinerariifolium]